MGLGSLASVRLISTLHEAPLRGFEDVSRILSSISEAPTAIQPASAIGNMDPDNLSRNILKEKSCKPVSKHGSLCAVTPRNKHLNTRLLRSPVPWIATFHRFIHRLWINLWINH